VNVSNDWDVSFAAISFLYGVLSSHQNIAKLARRDDILFELTRRKPPDQLRLLCCDQRSVGLDMVERARAAFAPLHILVTGAGNSGYTPEAKQYCRDAQIGLYNSTEINGALWREEFWTYHKVDTAGAPVYC
jgi:hypothetical protein